MNLPVGTHVMFTTPPNKKRYTAVIQEYLGYCSYRIRTPDNAEYIRTRYHLKPYVPNSALQAIKNNQMDDSTHMQVSS